MNCDVCGSEAENGRPCLECLTGQNERLLAENESFREVLGHREAQLYQVGGELREALLQVGELQKELEATKGQRDLNFNNKRHAEKLFTEERDKKEAAERLSGELKAALDRYHAALEVVANNGSRIDLDIWSAITKCLITPEQGAAQ